ncbi:uncharacterized protein LOC143922417 isoform X2 [Arctopsyche grandis]|uniref:uncharacterized protein LOC143922417 isoform X2 n=2 Tax=Arctopsyche grandis TaxID=121162 RepID=UPI00406D7415
MADFPNTCPLEILEEMSSKKIDIEPEGLFSKSLNMSQPRKIECETLMAEKKPILYDIEYLKETEENPFNTFVDDNTIDLPILEFQDIIIPELNLPPYLFDDSNESKMTELVWYNSESSSVKLTEEEKGTSKKDCNLKRKYLSENQTNSSTKCQQNKRVKFNESVAVFTYPAQKEDEKLISSNELQYSKYFYDKNCDTSLTQFTDDTRMNVMINEASINGYTQNESKIEYNKSEDSVEMASRNVSKFLKDNPLNYLMIQDENLLFVNDFSTDFGNPSRSS